jgi:hypothetical protein
MVTPNRNILVTGHYTYDDIYLHPSYAHLSTYANNGATTYTYLDQLTISSVKTPNFRRLKKSQYPFNNYSKVSRVVSDPGSTETQVLVDTAPPYSRRFVYHGFNVTSNPDTGSLVSAAVVPVDDPTAGVSSSLLQKLSLGKTNALVSLAEAHKTAVMLTSTVNRLTEAITALRQANLLKFARAIGIRISTRQRKRFNRRKREYWDPNIPILRDPARASAVERFAASTWLEYSYGWKPLLGDVYSSSVALAAVMVKHSNAIRTCSARGQANVSKVIETPVRNWVLRNSVNRSVSVKMSVSYKIDEGAVNPINVFGLQNPYIVAWELVPFSFVADWFIPIGNALQNLTATNGLTFVGGYTVTKRTDTSSCSYSPGTPWAPGGGSNPIWHAESGPAGWDEKAFSITRNGLASFPSVQFPAFKDPRSFSHAASAIALISSLWRK